MIWAGIRHDEAMHPPTEAQLDYLKALGYSGEPPVTKQEASLLIDGRKGGKKTIALEKTLLKDRQKSAKAWVKEQRHYAKMEVQQARTSEGAIAGFRIRVGKACHGAKLYHSGFLPTQVAVKHPELLPPYQGICQYGKCQCEFEEVLEDDTLSPHTSMIVAPGKVTTVRKHRKSKRRGARFLLLILIIVLLVYLLSKAF